MLKSMVVALDNTSSGRVAQELAIDLAVHFKAMVTGLGILRQPKPVTPRDMLRLRVEKLSPERVAESGAALQHIQEEAEKFAARCAEKSVECVPLARAGQAYPFIASESQMHDLVIVGRELNFADGGGGDSEPTIPLLLQHSVRPMIIAPPHPPRGETVLVAYDGSLPSNRALQLLALLGLDMGRMVHVLSVDDDASVAIDLAASAASYLEHHGINATPHGIASDEPAADVIAAKSREVKADMAVVGAFGHSGWRESVFGSSTMMLFRYARIPLFVSS